MVQLEFQTSDDTYSRPKFFSYVVDMFVSGAVMKGRSVCVSRLLLSGDFA